MLPWLSLLQFCFKSLKSQAVHRLPWPDLSAASKCMRASLEAETCHQHSGLFPDVKQPEETCRCHAQALSCSLGASPKIAARVQLRQMKDHEAQQAGHGISGLGSLL